MLSSTSKTVRSFKSCRKSSSCRRTSKKSRPWSKRRSKPMCRSCRAARAPDWPAALCPPRVASFFRLARLNHILNIDLENRIAIVEPGVINLDVTKAVAKDGFFYAPDPSSQAACSIGGNVANNSGGPHTLAYGVTTNHVLGVEVVLDDGQSSGSAEKFPTRRATISAVFSSAPKEPWASSRKSPSTHADPRIGANPAGDL